MANRSSTQDLNSTGRCNMTWSTELSWDDFIARCCVNKVMDRATLSESTLSSITSLRQHWMHLLQPANAWKAQRKHHYTQCELFADQVALFVDKKGWESMLSIWMSNGKLAQMLAWISFAEILLWAALSELLLTQIVAIEYCQNLNSLFQPENQNLISFSERLLWGRLLVNLYWHKWLQLNIVKIWTARSWLKIKLRFLFLKKFFGGGL